MELTLVIPTYNEADSIREVIAEWHRALAESIPRGAFRLLVINDGSKDNTLEILRELEKQYPELVVHSQANRGHGQSCLEGYRMAEKFGSAYTMQIDSDGQCDPAFFPEFWRARGQVGLYGRRVQRGDGIVRAWISLCLRWTLAGVAGSHLSDPNVPYRVYPASWAAEAARRVPAGFDLANIAVALILEPRGIRELPIHFRKRSGGAASVNWIGFARKARRLLQELRSIPISTS
jgi:glycosyltransferase involved in cell wall biosynthesis